MPLRTSAPTLALAALAAVTAPGERIERRVVAMGTELALEVEAETRGAALAASEAAVRAIEDAERRLSTWRDASELARFNACGAHEPWTFDDATGREVADALAWARVLDGAFDPTVGALVRAYDLRGAGRWPTDEELAAARAATGWRALAWSHHGLVKDLDGVIVEEGGFGKGAGLDAAARALAEHAPRGARLDLGGQVLWVGDVERTLAIAHPRERERAVVVVDAPPRATSAATTGNGELGREVDGRWLGHVLDPRTGRPARDFGALTVFAARGLAADACSTGLYVLGPECALAFVAERPDAALEVLVLETTPDGLDVRHSAGLDGRVRAATGFALAPTDESRRFRLREEREAADPHRPPTVPDPSDSQR